LVEETGVNHRPVSSYCHILSLFTIWNIVASGAKHHRPLSLSVTLSIIVISFKSFSFAGILISYDKFRFQKSLIVFY
jgi:hypothetical protein